jgi:uncharacterized membrane protein YhiD involved in acid resistance
MVLGTGFGIWAYFGIGFYVAALVSAAVSMLVVFVSMMLSRSEFDWQTLNEAKETQA